MITILRHEVSNVFECPVCGTLCLGRNHHCHTSGGDIAQSTGYIVVVNRRERWQRIVVIFHSSYITLALNSTLVLEVIWIVWHAEVVSSSSFVIVAIPSSSSRVDQLSSLVSVCVL